MTITEILESVQYVVDSQGKRTAVLFDMPAWETLRQLIEDWEDAAIIQKASQEKDEVFAWEQVVAEHQAKYNVTPDVQN